MDEHECMYAWCVTKYIHKSTDMRKKKKNHKKICSLLKKMHETEENQ